MLRPALIEFPADDPERARTFWSALLGSELGPRGAEQGAGWESTTPAVGGGAGASVGVHSRGRGPGDSFSLPYFAVDDLEAAMTRVRDLGGEIIHPGTRWAICRDTEGSPFGLAGG